MNKSASSHTSKKLTARDAIQVGLYAALVLFTTGVVCCIGFIPILYPLAPVAGAIAAGPVFFLFLSKIKRFGMITILSIIAGIFYTLTGHGIYSLLGGIFFGFLADYICSIGKYRSFKTIALGYGVYSLICPTTFLPMLFASDDFYAFVSGSMGNSYSSSLQQIMQNWVFPLVFLGSFLGGIIGAYLGRSVTKKHFRKSGVMGR